MRNNKQKSCKGKVTHETRDAAIIARRKVMGKYFKYSIIKCRYCRKWHIAELTK